MSLLKVEQDNLQELIKSIKKDFVDITFEISDNNSYSWRSKTIFYKSKKDFKTSASSILHELGHLQSEHKTYKSDIELLIIETEAWKKAQILSKKYGLKIDKEYIEDCLDSYRDWLHKRSTCPNCSQNGIQKDELIYICLNCSQVWQVSQSRFCRTYRKKKNSLTE